MNKKLLLILISIFIFSTLSMAITLPDINPSISISASPTSTVSTSIITAVGVDAAGSNPGLQWVQIYEDNNLLYQQTCYSTTCVATNSVVHTQTSSHNYYAKTLDLGNHLVQSSTITVNFAGINNNPIINSFSPYTPYSMDEGISQQFSVSASDPDGDALSYNWYIDGNIVSTQNPFDYTVPFVTSTEQHIFHVVVNDGKGGTATQIWNVEIRNLNHFPTLTNPTLNSPLYTNSIATCSPGIASDQDGDPLTTSFRWYLNNNIIPITANTLNLVSYGNKNDNLYCSEQIMDSFGYPSSWMNSNSVLISNSIPSISSASLTPASGTVTTQFTCLHSGFSDIDGDSDLSTIQWYNQNGLISGQTSSILTPGTYVKNDQIYCRVTPFDGTSYGNFVTSTNTLSISNTAPSIPTVTLNSPVYKNSILTCTASSTDIDNDPLTYTYQFRDTDDTTILQAYSTTNTFNCNTNIQCNKNDTIYCHAIANDGTANSNEGIGSTIILNSDPILNPIGNQIINENSTLTITLSASDIDNDILIYSVNQLLNSNLSGNIFTFTPNFTQAGIYNLNFSVSDGASQDSEAITITVNNVNRAPVSFSSILLDTPEDTGLLLNLGNFFTDSDGDTLNYSISIYPTNINASIYNTTYLFLIPNQDWNGMNSTWVVGTDPYGANSTMRFNLNVTPVNDAPILSLINNITANETDLVTITPIASDIDSSNLTFLFTSPFNSSGQWQTNYTSAGNYTTNVTVSDGSLTASQLVNIQILNINRAPTTSVIPTQTWAEDTNLTINLSNYFSDPDGDILTYSILLNPINIIVNIVGNNLTLNPQLNWFGTNTIQINASDGSASIASNIFNLNVTPVNDAPVLNLINNITSNENDLVTITPTATDIENDTITYSFTAPFNSSGQWQTDYNSAGNYSVNVTASDGSLTDSQLVNVQILNVNRAPTAINISNQTWNEDTNLTLNLSNYFSDPDGDSLTYSILLNPLNINPAINGANLILSPAQNWFGANTIQLNASDGSLSIANNIVNLIVNSVNDAPIASNDSYSLNEDTILAISAPGVLANDTDIDSAITSVLLTNPSNGNVILNNNGSFTYTPNLNYNGIDSFTYQATDGSLNSTATVTLTINSINDAPNITSTPVLTGIERTIYTYDVNATDIDNNPLNYSLTTFPAGMSINNNTGLIQWNPSYNQTGNNNVVVQVTDGIAPVTQVFIINVIDVPASITSYNLKLNDGSLTGLNNIYLSPQNNDGYLDGIQINATSDEIVNWSWEIRNLTTGQGIGPYVWNNQNTIERPSCYWNGTSNQCSGSYLSDGIYTITLILTDISPGSTFVLINTSKTITIDNTAPTTSDDYGIKNGTWQTTDQTITLTPSDNFVIDWTKYCIDATNTCTPSNNYTAPVLISLEGTNYFRYQSRDLAGNNQAIVSKTVMIDKSNPQYSNIIITPNTPAIYSPLTSYQFNVTWVDPRLQTVLIEHNFLGSLTNYTMSNNGNEFYYSISGISAGAYQWRSLANDSVGNANQTPVQSYIINRANPNLNLSTANWTILSNTPTTISCISNTLEVTPNLYLNNGLVANPYTASYAVGTYNFKCNNTQTQNYTSTEVQNILTVNPQPGTIYGYVWDNLMSPLDTAVVRLIKNGAVVQTYTTNSTGMYSFVDLEGLYNLSASKLGYVPQDLLNKQIIGGGLTQANFTLQLTLGNLSGRVMDNNGVPLNGALVVIDGLNTNTNSTGDYLINNIPVGTYSVTASLAGYLNQSINNVNIIQDQTTNINFNLLQTGNFVGRVIDFFTLIPLNNARVDVMQSSNIIATGYTNSTGDYILAVLPNNYDVMASMTGYNNQTWVNRGVTAGGNSIVNFALGN